MESAVSKRIPKISELLGEENVHLDLLAGTRDEVLRELVSFLKLGRVESQTLVRLLWQRERLGPTAIGAGFAIPHCRSLIVDRLHLVYGRKLQGINFQAVDKRPVRHFFLVVAPPVELSNFYLPTLGRIAQLCSHPDADHALSHQHHQAGILSTIDELGA